MKPGTPVMSIAWTVCAIAVIVTPDLSEPAMRVMKALAHLSGRQCF